MKIKNKSFDIPLIQGGMGVGVSLSNLATSVINEGAIGTISAAQIGFREEKFHKNAKESYKANLVALEKEVKKVRANSDGFLAVNILTATRQYAEIAQKAVELKVDAIISGAGLPLDLPKYIGDSETAAIPIVSSAKALRVICKMWKKKYNYLPDAVIVEGPEAGGHLGVSYADIGKKEVTLTDRFIEVKNFCIENDFHFPIFVAGGVYTAEDIQKYRNLGADGVQMATRFITTFECDAHEKFKNKFIESSKEDIVYVKSPVGYPGRALKNKFTDLQELGHIKVEKCVGCVLPCKGVDPSTVYCITDYLIKSVRGDSENGLIFSGSNGYRNKEIVHVSDLMLELKRGFEE